MAPIRRYLRITKYSVLECRIYLDNPALAESWLLNSRNPILPHVIESVRPLVLPKLREENERSKKSGKKKGVKDVVVEEDFEVSIFLTETSTRHSLLSKQKHFRDKGKKTLQSNSSKLTGDTNDTAIEVEDAPIIRREDSDEDEPNLEDLPAAEDEGSDSDGLFVDEDAGQRRSKRPRATTNDSTSTVSLGSEPSTKRRRDGQEEISAEDGDDKKKMAMDTTYDGFAIYGRVLCLVVKRKDKKGKGPASLGNGQATMENWITSTQMPPQDDEVS
ncbi:uncharacterized protein LY89DRAFT_2996 [Mollisia scopiformis]|uniref:Uncharacterized protein n=1 Tax=Mollisia scopiformis TaxID=149040 RepID=A0A194XVP9_MOLSC|nr:uncharacterized protein LY89DRAFT_2996 [Mollisia scopiformis]KUJ23787.1 hypothetical protein LY89DRAFT_2996 [Mollisia scopiformis]